MPHLHESNVRQEIGSQIVLFAHNASDVIAQAKGKRQSRPNLPNVLNVQAVVILREVPMRIPKISRRRVGFAK